VTACRKIENLIYHYAELIDAGDLPAVANLFRDGVIFNRRTGMRVQGYSQVLAMYESACRIYPQCGTPRTRHLTTNVIIETAGQTALSRSSFTVLQATQELPLQAIIAGRYRDQFVLTEEGWRFSEREMLVDFMGDCSGHLLYAGVELPENPLE
jgi:3-phenylpropionate/cinnamic acid dioxygenase small subunit